MQKHEMTVEQLSKRRAAKEYVASVLARNACINCGFKDARALDFHHDERAMMVHGPKRSTISKMVNEGVDVKFIRQEIKKCVVLCSNCHRIHHAEERKKYATGI